MFDQTFVNAHAQTRRPWTVAISVALQTALVAIALILPLLRVASLDAPVKVPVWFSVEKVDLKAKPEAKTTPVQSAMPRPVFHLAVLRPPTTVPARIDLSSDAPEIPTTGATAGSTSASIAALMPTMTIQPPTAQIPAVKPSPAPQSAPVRVGIGVQSAKLIFGPKPSYPALGKMTRTQGTVKIQAIIARDGSIQKLQVLSGPPLLVTAAIEAVQQWRYRPTLLNGDPVEVITEIDVNFTLSQ